MGAPGVTCAPLIHFLDIHTMSLQDAATAHLAKLPALCYALMACRDPGSRIVIIRAGETGCYVTDYDAPGLALDQVGTVVDRLNARLGITPAQKEAMLAGSLFGWHVPGADPDYYDASY